MSSIAVERGRANAHKVPGPYFDKFNSGNIGGDRGVNEEQYLDKAIELVREIEMKKVLVSERKAQVKNVYEEAKVER